MFGFERVKDIEQSDVVPVRVSKLVLFTICDLCLVSGPDENVGHVQTSDD